MWWWGWVCVVVGVGRGGERPLRKKKGCRRDRAQRDDQVPGPAPPRCSWWACRRLPKGRVRARRPRGRQCRAPRGRTPPLCVAEGPSGSGQRPGRQAGHGPRRTVPQHRTRSPPARVMAALSRWRGEGMGAAPRGECGRAGRFYSRAPAALLWRLSALSSPATFGRARRARAPRSCGALALAVSPDDRREPGELVVAPRSCSCAAVGVSCAFSRSASR